MKNKRLIKYILMSFIVLFFTTFIAVIIENDTNSKQNEKINDEISKIINVFVDQYGLSEKEVIDIYLKAQNKDHTIINKYDFLNTTEYNNKIYLSPLISFILISLLLVLIIMIGISRIYLGVHYPSDVIGGFVGGLAYLLIFIEIIKGVNYEKK